MPVRLSVHYPDLETVHSAGLGDSIEAHPLGECRSNPLGTLSLQLEIAKHTFLTQ